MPKKEKKEDTGRFVLIGNSEENKKLYESNYISTTRYTLINFLPKSIMKQFTRYANIYFLVVASLQSIPAISPLNPLSSIFPLSFVIFLSVLREGVEDYGRYKSDIQLNSSYATKYSDGGWRSFEWKQIYVGDVVKVEKDAFFPADLILLGSSEDEGVAYIQTSSLDGEKNLKPRLAFKETQAIVGNGDVMRVIGTMDLPAPNSNLYDARGTIQIGGSGPLNIGDKNFMLRGAMLKNTDWIVGVVAYTGKETKIMMNAEDPKYKQSNVEKTTNKMILMIFAFQVSMGILIAILSSFWMGKYREKLQDFIGRDQSHLVFWGFMMTLTIFVLTNSMIPISLIISLEMVKLCQAFFINMDDDMYNEEVDKHAKVFTSSLNEELGQIEFIFSDKTGTLTCNKMEFKMCIIGDVLYGDSSCIEEDPKAAGTAKPPNMKTKGFYDKRVANLKHGLLEDKPINFKLNDHLTGKTVEEYKNQSDLVREYFYLLALCHDCVLEKDEDGMRYQGESPDEIALVKTAKQMGYMFNGASSGVYNLIVHGEHQPIEQLILFPFNSKRKRASVIVRLEGKIKLLTKGADSIIIERLAPRKLSPQPYLDWIVNRLEAFSKIGLRTLCMAERVISDKEFEDIQKEYLKACVHKEAKQQVGR